MDTEIIQAHFAQRVNIATVPYGWIIYPDHQEWQMSIFVTSTQKMEVDWVVIMTQVDGYNEIIQRRRVVTIERAFSDIWDAVAATLAMCGMSHWYRS